MSIFQGCNPVRCPTTAIFNLDVLLQASTAMQEAEAHSLDTMDDRDPMDDHEPSRPLGLRLDEAAMPSHTEALGTPSNAPNRQSHNYQHRFRKRKRDEEIQMVGHVRRPKTLSTLVPLALQAATPCHIDYIDLPATQGAYGATVAKKKNGKSTQEKAPHEQPSLMDRIQELEDRPYTLQEVQAMGVRVFPWDGV